MTTMGRHNNFNSFSYNSDTCRKIAVAIKKSNVFGHIKPINLLKEKLGIYVPKVDNIEDIPQKRRKLDVELNVEHKTKAFSENKANTFSENKFTKANSPLPDIVDVNCQPDNTSKVIQSEGSKDITNLSVGLLPSPEKLFDASNESDNTSVNSLILKDQCTELQIPNADETNIFQEEYLKNKDILERISEVYNKKVTSNSIPDKNNKFREKQNKNLFTLAASLLPAPSQFYDRLSLINALEGGVENNFINIFKEAIMIKNQISSDDLCAIFNAIIELKANSLLPQFCICLEYQSSYSQALSESFINYHDEIKDYHDNVLNCLLTMIEQDNSANITNFIEACYCISDWNKMWSGVLSKNPTYKFDDKYFKACMATFQNLSINSASVNHDTMIIIISYIMRNYYENYEMYMADIWLYCVLTTDLSTESDLKVPQQILDKVIDKLIVMKNPSFLFIMKLLSKNWSLLCNNTFCVWFSELISDKSDVKKCLSTVKESIESMNQDNEELYNSFLLLSINVMSVLNKKSLFTCSKNIYDTFLQNKLDQLKALLSEHSDRFKYKWNIVECLISSTEYQNALKFLKEFDVLKDLEISFIEYSRVKDILPNLVWHLLNISSMVPVIELFEQVVSIFIFNENNDSSYTKNCNEIFDLIVLKAFESNDKEVVMKMLLLLDHILSADIEFNISKECLRYLLVASVRTDIPFNELLDFIDLCFKYEIFETIHTADDSFGSFVEVYSNITKEEVFILTTWLCRHVKIRLVDLAQTEGAPIRENLMKVCSIKFVLRPSNTSDNFIQKLGSSFSFDDLLTKFTETLNCPKYLSHPIKFSTNRDVSDELSIICDSRVVYNAIYYSDI